MVLDFTVAKFVGAAFPNGASKDEKGCHVFQRSSGNLAAKGRLTGWDQ